MDLLVQAKATLLVYVEEDHALEAGKWRGILYVLGNEALKWRACSGPHGKGPAPKGMYQVAKPTALIREGNAAYTDAAGNTWFAGIKPTFPTTRSSFGIHPDGNVPGTLGCIGITEPDTKEVFNYLNQSPDPIMLFVV
jgi:hypothetical protein